jgi:hypothetical protein
MSNCIIETDGGYVKLTDKNGVNLYMLKENDKVKFRINFDISNHNYDLNKAIGFKLFGLMAELNKDIIDRIALSKYDDDSTEIDMGIIFCRFGTDLGLAQKYIYSHSVIEKNGDLTTITSEQIPKPDNFAVPPRSEPALSSYSKIDFRVMNDHYCSVVYVFVLDLEEDLPIYMEKLPGSLMHKVFSRLKVFIETLV